MNWLLSSRENSASTSLPESRNNSFGDAACLFDGIPRGLLEEPFMERALKIQESLKHRLDLFESGWNRLEVVRSLQWHPIVAANHSLKRNDLNPSICKALGNFTRKVLNFGHHLMHVDLLAVQRQPNGRVVMRGIRWGTFSDVISDGNPECCDIKFSKKNQGFDSCPRPSLDLGKYQRQATDKQSDYHCNASSNGGPRSPVHVTSRTDGPAFTEAFLPTHSLIPLWTGRHFAMGAQRAAA